MKVATILISGALLLTPALAWAQGANSGISDKPSRAENEKIPHGAFVSPRDANNSDRAIAAELKRIDRMMVICNGC